jgi:serine/threonine protein kinase/WD40 repeat protein/tetratricopeptide (TPR) repeat protein
MGVNEASPESVSARDPVEELAETFLERYRRGERPSLSEFMARAPEHADEIRDLFPALVLMEQGVPPVGADSTDLTPAVPLERLGDYRVIREIGRGGMGIVYEAEQEALGRHVALKVLPSAAARQSRCLLRFRREARSAARLHHTNIVPVFDIGEREGLHYYAMQFIQGQSLDAVITELHRLRHSSNLSANPRTCAGIPPSSAAVNLAGSMLSGEFRREEASASDRQPAAEVEAPSTPVRAAAEASSDSSPSSVLDGDSDFSTKSDYHFYRSVAKVGLQIADALAYAHGQGVLHRDIKPSNLLLDARGTIWVTDFGLAKEEGGDLTRTGEVVGTVRYMAPERFSSHSDARSDIYSLGLTLYELLTLRPAFGETDRARLVYAITHQEPLAPRKSDPHVPRDLETIVLKAITKEPVNRYANAEDLEEDLRRFLADRPIRARRASQWERVRRWCRRNPGWAATIATVLGLLLVMAVGGTIFSLYLERALHELQIADAEKVEKLWQADLERARALRSSGRVGQRFEALRAIREAAQIKVTPELRDEAVAALVLPDVEIAREWEGCPLDTLFLANDATFERYARVDKLGALTVCRLSENGEELIARLPAHGKSTCCCLYMSPDGRYVVYGHSSPSERIAGGMRIWQIDGPAPKVYCDVPKQTHVPATAFHSNGRWVAMGHLDGTIGIYDLQTRSSPQTLKIGQVANVLAFHPRDGRLAAACGTSIRLFDVDAGKELLPLRLPKIDSWSIGLAWHPDGRLLAATSEDRKIHIWDTHTAAEVMAPLPGHHSGITMAFNHTGDRLISCGYDGQTRLWDAVTGQLLLTMPGQYGAQFSPNDSLIGVEHSGTKLRLWRLADGRELRAIRRRGAEAAERILNPVLDADDRVMAAASANGLGFFELESGKELAFVYFHNPGLSQPRTFDRTSGWMTCGRPGVVLWPLQEDPTRNHLLRIGPPRAVASAIFQGADASLDGRIRAIPQGEHALVLDRDRPGWRTELGPQYDVRNCAVSPDGRWVATCSWWQDPNHRSKSVRIWEAESGRHIIDLPVEGSSYARFSPDGRWLATHAWEDSGCRLWEVGSWRAGVRLGGYFCWNTDGRLLAVQDLLSVIRLVEPQSGKEIFRLTGPEATWYSTACLTRDGARLIATVLDYSVILVWDLRLIRKELQELGMDWDWPEFPPVPKSRTSKSPLTVQVDPGIFDQPPFKDDHLAVAVFSLQIILQPLNFEAYFERGMAYARLEDRAKAVADYEMFLRLAPKNDRRRPDVQFRRALIYHDYFQDDRSAVAAVAEAADASVDSIGWPGRFATLCNDLAWQTVKDRPTTRPPAPALRLARKAVEIEPHNWFFQNTLGVVLYRLGEYQEAARCLDANAQRSGRYAAFDLYFLAMCTQRLGNPAKAREYFDRANAFTEGESGLSPVHRQELTAFRAEANEVLGISKAK